MLMCYNQLLWTTYIRSMVSAWESIGLGSAASLGSEAYPTATDLIYYTTAGGVHNLISWVDTISYGLPLMYQTGFPEFYSQRNAHTVWEFPTVKDFSGDTNNDNTLFVVIIVFLCASVVVNIFLVYYVVNTHKNKQKSSKDLEESLLYQ